MIKYIFLVAGIIVGYALSLVAPMPVLAPAPQVSEMEEKQASSSAPGDIKNEPSATPAQSAAISIDITTLPTAQQTILKTLGIEDTLVVTSELRTCVESVLGVDRVSEIISGQTPGAVEVTQIIKCL